MMSLHTETAARPIPQDFFGRPPCPECGAEALAPEQSAFVGDDRVRHRWLCEECDAGFTTFAAFGAFRG